jgi:hypothetical protein
MSEDPKLFDTGDYNLFRYCHNDPVDNVDPMGLASEQTGDLSSGTHDREWKVEVKPITREVTGSHIPETVGYQVTVTGQSIRSRGPQERDSGSTGTPNSFRILEGQTVNHGTWNEYQYQAYVNSKPTYTSAYEVKEKMTKIYSSKNVEFRDSGRDWTPLNRGRWSDNVGFHGRLPRMALDIHEQQWSVRRIGDHGSGTLMESHFLHMSNVSHGRVDNVVIDMGSHGYFEGY